jgi:hypothetical protein
METSEKKKAQSGAKLIVDNIKEREILDYTFKFTKSIDAQTHKVGLPVGGSITLTVKALSDGNPELFVWLLNSTSQKKGKIEVKVPGDDKKLKDIEFTGACCIEYEEKWNMSTPGKDPTVAYPHTEKIIISCETLTNGATFDKNSENKQKDDNK